MPGAVAPVDYGFRATECPGSGCVDAFVAEVAGDGGEAVVRAGSLSGSLVGVFGMGVGRGGEYHVNPVDASSCCCGAGKC